MGVDKEMVYERCYFERYNHMKEIKCEMCTDSVCQVDSELKGYLIEWTCSNCHRVLGDSSP